MDERLTHASFFSGVGGLDMGLDRAGWRTVSFSEIDPYASAVLTQRWPGVPNLGSIIDVVDRWGSGQFGIPEGHQRPNSAPDDLQLMGWDQTSRAALWTGGFPCQDLSVAGKRRGMGAGTRSGLAYAFLTLAERHRPRFILLENVPGLLSSHAGRDMATLIGTLVELGYGVGYRVLDARYFGVPQRRRRVFILGDSLGGRAGAERAAEVLSVGSRCRWHPPAGVEARPGVAAGAPDGTVGTFTPGAHPGSYNGQDAYTGHLIGTIREHVRPGSNTDHTIVQRPPPDPGRVRAPDGLAGRSHDRDGLADTLRVGGRASGAGDIYDNTPWVATGLRASDGHHGHGSPRGDGGDNLIAETLNSGGNSGGFRTEPGAHLTFVKNRPAGEADPSPESWSEGDTAPTVDSAGHGPRTATAILGAAGMTADPLLPPGLDSHRYRCCGNGVVADVAEWIGLRLAEIA